MSSSSCSASIRNAKVDHRYTLIFSHGLGDNSMGWHSELTHLLDKRLPQSKYMKVICPNAPSQPVTLNMGMRMPSWYDIKGLSSRDNEDCKGIEQSRETILALMKEEMEQHKIPAESIFVGGFSQGGALSLYTVYQLSFAIGGCIGLSTYLPLAEQWQKHVSDEAKATPLFMGHGDADPLVRLSWGEESFQRVKKVGVKSTEFHKYRGMQHSSCMQELEDVIAFIRNHIESRQPSNDYTNKELLDMKISQLKQILAEKGGSCSGLLEKYEFIEAILKLQQQK